MLFRDTKNYPEVDIADTPPVARVIRKPPKPAPKPKPRAQSIAALARQPLPKSEIKRPAVMLARGLVRLRDGKAWTTAAMARTKDGRSADATAPNAHKFCTLGVLQHVMGEQTSTTYRSCVAYLDRAAKVVAPASTSSVLVNDRNPWHVVKRMWITAIALARKAK